MKGTSIGVPFVPLGMSAASPLKNPKLVYQHDKESILKSANVESANVESTGFPKIAKSYQSSASNLLLNIENEDKDFEVTSKNVRFMPAIFFRVSHLFSYKATFLLLLLFTISPLFWVVAVYYFKVHSKADFVQDIKEIFQNLNKL